MGKVDVLGLYPKARCDLAARKAGQAANRFGLECFDGTCEQGYGDDCYWTIVEAESEPTAGRADRP
ncbi:MAG: hypothetical protein ACREFM_04195 [Hypericibacter sp.]